MGAIVSASGNWEVSWPWPQVKFLQKYTLAFAKVVDALYLYELEVIDGSWNATEVMQLAADASKVTQISVADFGAFLTLSVYEETDDVITCWIRNPGIEPDVIGAYSSLPTINSPKFITACNFKGQCLIGGIETSDATWAGLDHHSIAWSEVGAFNFRYQDKATAGFGYTPYGLNGEGRVLRILRLGDGAIAYSNLGITPMMPNKVGWSLDKVFKVPIYSGNCVDGDNNVHFFIDKNKELWKYTKDGLSKLGFKSYLAPLFDTTGPVLVRYEPHNKRLYISDGLTSYILTSSLKLYSCHQCVTSIGYSRGRLAGFFYDTQDYEGIIGTNTMDIGMRSIKTITLLETAFDSDILPLAMVMWRNDIGSFKESTWKYFNSSGVVFPIVAGVDLRIFVKISDYRLTDFNMDYLKAKIKVTDKRYIRGTYAVDKTSR